MRKQQRLFAILGFGDDVDRICCSQQGTKARAHQRVVVYEQDSRTNAHDDAALGL
jgi:hypothetical protein